ncbi:MAG: class I SAM-dependent methyltransferase [Ktedonobacterales bacterium]|nr:class I SAM-dependent methyltransferase [Ktedonobacterales bacterium]
MHAHTMFTWLTRRRRATRRLGMPTQTSAEDHRYFFISNDQGEAMRLNLQHFMFAREFGSDRAVPVQVLPQPIELLDVACGTGFWAIQQAKELAPFGANVVGFDKQLPAATTSSERPDNCLLIAGDALDRFPFGDAAFSYVMMRACSAFVPRAHWPAFLREAARVTRPGGFVEVRDFGVVVSESQAMTTLTRIFTQLADSVGIYPGAGPHLRTIFSASGFSSPRIMTRQVRFGRPRGTPGGSLMVTDYLAVLKRVTVPISQSGITWNHSPITATRWADWLVEAEADSQQGKKTAVQLTCAVARRAA